MLSGISLPHILLLLLIVVLIFGTSKLKNVGKDLGGAIKGFKESMRGDDEQAVPPAAPQTRQQPPVIAPTSTAPTSSDHVDSTSSHSADSHSSSEPRQGQ